jgi:mannose-6-phosphate isomerase-like protein (cupin superfamily)
MNKPGIPIVVSSANVEEYTVGENGDEGTIKRLIGRENNSKVLLGTFRLDPRQRGSFDLPHEIGLEEETYYLLGGRLRVRWGEGDGEFVAEPGQAIFFPPGGRYYIEALGDAPVELVWTGFPAP